MSRHGVISTGVCAPESVLNKPEITPTSISHHFRDTTAAGWAEFLRNLALLFFGAPFVEPLLSGAPLDGSRAIVGLTIGVVIMVASSILDNERRD